MVINPVHQSGSPASTRRRASRRSPRRSTCTQVFAVNALDQRQDRSTSLPRYAKANPKTLSYMARVDLTKVAFIEEFNRKNGIDFVRVPFKGGGDAVNSMMTGTTQIAIFGIGNLIQFIRDGKIVGFAVDGDKRSPLAPEIPTFSEIGYTKPSRPDILRHLCADRHAAGRSSTNSQAASSRSPPTRNSRRRHMTFARARPPVLNTPEEFAKELVAGARRRACSDQGLGPLSGREVRRRGEGVLPR